MSEAPKGYRLAKLASEINVGIEIILENLKKKKKTTKLKKKKTKDTLRKNKKDK